MSAAHPTLSRNEKLDRLAEVAVRVGLRLAPGQELVMTAPLEALPLARLITEHAYRVGATLVTTILADDEMALARFANASDASFDHAPGWLFNGMAAAYKGGAARLAIAGDNPSLLSGQDPEKVARANKSRSSAYKPAQEPIVNFDINWTIVAHPHPAWAKTMFPGDDETTAMDKLYDAIFAASRVDVADPVGAWEAHNASLHRRTAILNDKRFHSLHYTGPGTDLTIGLADEHEWHGGASVAKNGITCNPNIPTEEVFTTPHRGRVSGTVASTKPLAYQGTLIDGIRVRFEGGAIVEAHADKGADVLARVLESDEGSRRLGEVALVPHSSPISKSGLLFYNTLFDENASSHIALGQSYSKCFVNGGSLTPEELLARGANNSVIHIDWMIGSDRIDIDGVHADGRREPVMRGGEWI
jgi:aminopeptidase